MSEEKTKYEKIVELLMHENNTLKAALLESERRLDNGMTMRDHFAVLAMQGYVRDQEQTQVSNEAIAQWAYELADAMLKAREVGDE